MKRLWLLVVFYCLVQGSSGDFVVTYEGMDQEMVTKIVQETYGAPFKFINEEAYKAFVKARQPPLSARSLK